MKRRLATLIAAAMLCSLSACTQEAANNTETTTEPAGAASENTMSLSYRSQEILSEECNDRPAKFIQFGKNVFIHSPQQDNSAIIGVFSPNSGEVVQKQFPNTELMGTSVQGNTIAVLLCETNMDPYEFRYLYRIYDNGLNELGTEDVTEIWGKNKSGMSWAEDAQGNAYMAVIAEGIACHKPDGGTVRIPKTEGNETLFTGRDDSVYAIYDGRTLYRLKPEAAETIPLELPRVGGNSGILLPGNAQYDVLCYTNEALYGLVLADGSWTELVNWEDSNLYLNYDCHSALPLPDGSVLVSIPDDSQWTYQNLLLTARTQEDFSGMRQITMATMSAGAGNSWLDQMVRKFNQQSEDCRIEMVSYFDEAAADQGTAALKADMLSGDIPDILASCPDYHMFSNKGVFEDLSVWMENDPDFHEDEYMMNFFDSLKYKDRLERIGFQYAVNVYAAKTEFVNGAQQLTLTDYAQLELPEGMSLLSSADRQSAFDDLMFSQLGAFVDYESAACSFESVEFIELLAWFGSFPETAAVQDDYAYRENRALLYPTQIGNLEGYHAVVQCWFDNAEVTLTGTPIGNEGNGGVFAPLGLITVSSASEYKEEIWEFIKFCLNEDNQMHTGSYGFPIHLKALSRKMEESQEERSATNTVFYEFGGEPIEITPSTAEEAAVLTEYLKGITVCSLPDDFLYAIVEEETAKFFTGDCTAEDAARMIQSRVSLYLAEQY